MTRVVADASFCGAWILDDEHSPEAEALLASLEAGLTELILPSLWHYEMLNLVRSALRRNRLPEDAASAAMEALGAISLLSVDVPDPSARKRIFELSMKHELSAYDAAYLELAQRLQVPLRTADRKLAAAVLAERLSLQ